MSSEPASALLGKHRLTVPDLAPGALDDEVDTADLWLVSLSELCPDPFDQALLGGVEVGAAALLARPAPVLFVVGIGPNGLPQVRLVPRRRLPPCGPRRPSWRRAPRGTT